MDNPRPRGTCAPLPEALTSGPVSMSAATAAGISRRELRDGFWQRTTRGFYIWTGVDPDDVELRLAQAAALLPTGAALGGWASLYLQGVTDLDGGANLRIRRTAGLRRSRAASAVPRPATHPAPVLVCVGPGSRIRPRVDLDLSRRVLPEEDVVMASGVPCVRAARAVFELVACQAPEDGLVSLDAALRARIVTVADITAFLAEHRGLVGSGRLRRLLTLADAGARSCPESRLRWVWMMEAGLPRPCVNVAVHDLAGHLLGIPDLLDPNSGLVGEYDGAQHRELHSHTSDNAREEGFERHNLLVVRATVIDLFPGRRQLVARLRAAHRDGLQRDRSRDRWRIAGWAPSA